MMTVPPPARAGVFALLLVTALAGSACQSRRPRSRGAFRVTWSAYRAQDNTPLATVTSPLVGVGGAVDVRTDAGSPTDDRAAFPRFTAQLSPDPQPGKYQLVTRAYVREVNRTKKGKRKVDRRIIGGLLPLRAGETLGLNGPGDPIRLDVRLEASGVRSTH